jgi:DNA-3-methyladenine glycosylase I
MAAIPDGLIVDDQGRPGCWWATDELYRAYHGLEWGRPVREDHRLFEKLCLEGFQSGLSWLTILRKRPAFRAAFLDFDFQRVAPFDRTDVERLLGDAGIVRHRGKIEATIHNAGRALELVKEFGSLAAYFWQWEPLPEARSLPMNYETVRTLSQTPESIALSKDLRRRGWQFVGPTTVYAFMQAMGLVNDHVEGCFVRDQVEQLRLAFHRP